MRTLTGVKPTGIPHLGNLLGAIKPCIEDENETLLFIADLHSLTTVKDPNILNDNIRSVASIYLACGFDYENNILFKQSDIPQVTELYYLLNTFASLPKIQRMHSYKVYEEEGRLNEMNLGTLSYPILMASDILLYDTDYVPVGKDQKQHIDITRFLARKFNSHYKEEILKLPTPIVDDNLGSVPGIDGRKMSKSYGNTICPFGTDKSIRKSVMKIVSDSKQLGEPLDYTNCTIFKLISLLSDNDDFIDGLKVDYVNGHTSYGEMKNLLFEMILLKYSEERIMYNEYYNDTEELRRILKIGSEKASVIAEEKVNLIKNKMGFIL